jgi:hypothetical protein
VVVGAAFLVAMNPTTAWIDQIRLEKPPDVLVDRARDLVKKAGYTSAPVDRAYGFLFDEDFLRYVDRDKKARRRYLKSFMPAFFWYRESAQSIQRSGFGDFLFRFGGVTYEDPPLRRPGEFRARLDGTGRLWSFEAIPPDQDSSPASNAGADWALLFSEAGLDISAWRPSAPQWNPASYADTRAAWEGSFPDMPDVPLRVEAAAYRGRPVSFFIVGPWTQSLSSSAVGGRTAPQQFGGILAILLVAAVVGGALFFASRNLRSGRGDRRGAWRLAALVLALNSGAWLLSEHHVAGFGELSLLFNFGSWALTMAGVVWIMYVALEPFVRRRWPHVLVSWTRVWSGGWWDPLVGRDVLIGCAAGIGTRIVIHLWLLASSDFELAVGLEPIRGTAFFLANLLVSSLGAIMNGLTVLFLFFFLRTVIRSQRVALVSALVLTSLALGLGWAVGAPGASSLPWVNVAIVLMLMGASLWLLVSFGLVAPIVASFMTSLFVGYPITLQSTWYASYGYASLAIVGAIAVYGFKVSLGGQPLLAPVNFDEV